MTPLYHYRIMACLPGHSPVEIHRGSEPLANWVWNLWTRDLSPEWQVWPEFTMHDKDCITSRPVTRAPHVAAMAKRARLYPVNPHQEPL